jgi:hypothetical protein
LRVRRQDQSARAAHLRFGGRGRCFVHDNGTLTGGIACDAAMLDMPAYPQMKSTFTRRPEDGLAAAVREMLAAAKTIGCRSTRRISVCGRRWSRRGRCRSSPLSSSC